MTLSVSLDMLDYVLLKKPLNFSTIHWITRQAINFPTNNSLRLATLNTRKHVVKNWATGNFCGSFFYKLIRDINTFSLGEFPQFGELGFNGENLFVLYISAFASIQKVFNHELYYTTTDGVKHN